MKTDRESGFYWVRPRQHVAWGDTPDLTVASWDAETQSWDAIGYIDARPDETFDVVSGRLAPPAVEVL